MWKLSSGFPYLKDFSYLSNDRLLELDGSTPEDIINMTSQYTNQLIVIMSQEQAIIIWALDHAKSFKLSL